MALMAIMALMALMAIMALMALMAIMGPLAMMAMGILGLPEALGYLRGAPLQFRSLQWERTAGSPYILCYAYVHGLLCCLRLRYVTFMACFMLCLYYVA